MIDQNDIHTIDCFDEDTQTSEDTLFHGDTSRLPKSLRIALAELKKRSHISAERHSDTYKILVNNQPKVIEHMHDSLLNVVFNVDEGVIYKKAVDNDETPSLLIKKKLNFIQSVTFCHMREIYMTELESGVRPVITEDELKQYVASFSHIEDEKKNNNAVDSIIKYADDNGFIKQMQGQKGHYIIYPTITTFIDFEASQNILDSLQQFIDDNNINATQDTQEHA